jgi:hypothetical protein
VHRATAHRGAAQRCRRSSTPSRAAPLSASGERWDKRRQKMVPRGGGGEERGRGTIATWSTASLQESGTIHHTSRRGVSNRGHGRIQQFVPTLRRGHARGAGGTARRKRLNLHGGLRGTHGGVEVGGGGASSSDAPAPPQSICKSS